MSGQEKCPKKFGEMVYFKLKTLPWGSMRPWPLSLHNSIQSNLNINNLYISTKKKTFSLPRVFMRFGGTKGEIRVKKGDLGEISPKKYFFLFNFFFLGGGAPLSPLIIMKYKQ